MGEYSAVLLYAILLRLQRRMSWWKFPGCSTKHVEAGAERYQRLVTVQAAKGFKILFLNTTPSLQKSREEGVLFTGTKQILCKKA